MHKQHHRHVGRRLLKRDDPPSVNLDVLGGDVPLEKREPDVATIYSVVYVTASATFSGPTAGFKTLNAPTSNVKIATTQAAHSNSNNKNNHDEHSTVKPKQQTSATSQVHSQSSAKSTKAVSSSNTPKPVVSASSSSLHSSLHTSLPASSSILTASPTRSAASTSAVSSNVGAAGLAAATVSSTASATAAAASSGMSGGAKAGIAFAVIALVGLVAGLALFAMRKKKATQAGMQQLHDEKSPSVGNGASNAPSNIPVPPSAGSHSQTPPRLTYRPGSQFSPKVFGDVEKAAVAAGAGAGAGAGAMYGASQNEKTESAWDRRPSTATSDPSNPFGSHAQTFDAQPKTNVAPIPEGRSLGPPIELQGNPVTSPTRDDFDLSEAKPEISTAAVATAATLPVIAAAAAAAGAAGPPGTNVHRVQLEFKPSMEDEIELKVGQIVRVLHEYDDGWALCIRMDRSQQGVAPRTCLSKQPLKPRPMGPPPNGNPNGPPRGPPTGPPNGPPRGPQNGRPNGPPRTYSNGPPNGQPRPGPGPQGRQALPSQARPQGPPATMSQTSMVPRPLSPNVNPGPPAQFVLQQPQKRSRSASVAAPNIGAPLPSPNVPLPFIPGSDSHRRSVSMGSVGSPVNSVTSPAAPSPLGVPARKPVPGQAM